MKIIFVTDTMNRGGKERQLSMLYSQLCIEHEIRIISAQFEHNNNYLSEFNIPSSSICLYKGLKDFKNIIKAIKPDLVFTWDFRSSLFTLIIRFVTNFIFINGSIRHGIRSKKVKHYLRSLIAWFSPYIIANSFAGLKANNLSGRKNTFVLYNGFDYKFLSKNRNKSELIKKYFFDYNEGVEIIFVSVANLVPYKDYFTVLDVLASINNILPYRYFIIGEGPMRSQIEEHIHMNNLSNRVVLLGKIDEVSRFLSVSDIMIHSSKGEGISNAILEAMFVGLPVIATNVGGVPETVFPEFSRLFEYQNKIELKKHLLESRQLIDNFNLQDNDYQEHLKKFTVEQMKSEFDYILELITSK